MSAADIGIRAARIGAVLYELTPQQASLEDAFMTMTRDEVEFHSHHAPAETDDRTAA